MYDHEKVSNLLAAMKDLRDTRKQETQRDINARVQTLTPEDKYALGLNIIVKIGKEVEKLKPYHHTINKQTVFRADLQTTRENPYVTGQACKWYLEYIGFYFMQGVFNSTETHGEIGYPLRMKNKDAKSLCTLFIAKRKDSGSLFLNWSRALANGFIYDKNMTAEAKKELRKVETSTKAVVDAIWNHIQDFESLNIEIED